MSAKAPAAAPNATVHEGSDFFFFSFFSVSSLEGVEELVETEQALRRLRFTVSESLAVEKLIWVMKKNVCVRRSTHDEAWVVGAQPFGCPTCHCQTHWINDDHNDDHN